MRQVFSSPRLENVEGVARLLEEAGIEVKVTNGRSYRGNRRGNFRYGDSESPKAAVWVVKSDDQVRARGILREAGLIDSTRNRDSFVASFREDDEVGAQVDRRRQRIVRVKYALLVGLLIGAGAMAVHMIRSAPDAPVPATPDPAPAAAATGSDAVAPPFDGKARPTPAAVAAAVFAHELPEARLDIACLSIDGRDAPAPMIESLQAGLPAGGALRLVSASTCIRNADENEGSTYGATRAPALVVDVAYFTPSDADTGTVDYAAYHHRLFATYRTVEVRRVDGEWQVSRVLRKVSI